MIKKIVLALALSVVLFANEITVAAAASYRNALEELAPHFKDAKVTLIFNASGKFYQQITNGAPFDLFMAADMKYPEEVVANGFANGEVVPTVANRLILWSRNIDVSGGMSVLLDKKVKKVAIANPKTAPLGMRAYESLNASKIYDKVEKKLVYGESISHATHFVESGAAEVGITGFSVVADIINSGKGNYYLISADLHGDMSYGTVILKSTKNLELSQKFVEFLKSREAKEVFNKHGLQVIE